MPTTQSRCNSRGNQDAAAKSSRNPYFVLPILSAVTLLLSMEITNKSMSQQQRWLMRIFLLASPSSPGRFQQVYSSTG